MHLTYVALHELTWCMVVWCTQNAPRWQQFHVAPAMPALYVCTPLRKSKNYCQIIFACYFRKSSILYVHGNQKARWDGQPRTATSTLTQLLDYDIIITTYSLHSACWPTPSAQKTKQKPTQNNLPQHRHIYFWEMTFATVTG